MRCIFCLQERRGTIEHVFPFAIGGRLTTDRVCEPCNSTLGTRVDAALSDNLLVRLRRSELGLAGHSGKLPPMHEILLGKHKIAADPKRHVQVRFDEATGKMDIRALHHASDIVMPDGTKVRRITVDERDKTEIPKIIQRERKRHGLPPLSAEELAVETQKATENVIAVENPQVHMELSINFAYLRHALIKIAYELAFLWLGESYLDDPSAAELRAAIGDPAIDSTDDIPGYIGTADECGAFKLWSADKLHHLGLANPVDHNNGIAIAVRIFNIYAAVVLVTKDDRKYLTGRDGHSRLRFLAIEPVSGNMADVPLMQEFRRI